MIVLSATYVLSALFCFATWFNVFRKDTHLSPEQKRISKRVLIVATLLWPIVVPISYLEKRSKKQQPFEYSLEIETIETISATDSEVIVRPHCISSPGVRDRFR
ncbi:MAG: hypothetical protein LDL41_25535 [Coleofasciculus sp. S288]|nr:hypothetical protein [Coleofasciculus sp. S288]